MNISRLIDNLLKKSRCKFIFKAAFTRRKFHDINVIKSKSPVLTIPNKLICEYVWENLDKWYNKTAVICSESGRKYTYGDIYNKSKSLAKNLQNKFTLNTGDTVAIILPNVLEFPIVLLGCIEAGLVATMVNPFYTADEMQIQLQDSRSKLLFTTSELLDTVKVANNLSESPIPIITTDSPQGVMSSVSCIRLDELCQDRVADISNETNSDNVALLPYSSGTTGLPKGVELTHKNVVSNLYQMSSRDFALNLKTSKTVQDVIPLLLPMFHIYGLVAVFLNFFSQGCQLVTVPNLTPSRFKNILKNHQPSLLFAVPPIISLLLNNPRIQYEHLSPIRMIISAAAPLGITAMEKFTEKTQGKIDLLQMYGMTETSPLTLMQTKKVQFGTQIGGSGLLIPNTECKIVSLNDNTNIGLSVEETGELLMRGPQIMKGYHNNPQATKEVLLEDGWLKTGDIGHYDEHQHFFITDRLKELIKVKGFQVAPAELEEVLKTHQSVKDAAVVGVPHAVHGEVPKAFVVLKENFRIKPSQLNEYVVFAPEPFWHRPSGCPILVYWRHAAVTIICVLVY